MSTKPQPALTPAQETLYLHLLSGGTVTRNPESVPGKGYFAKGIKMLLPATVKALINLQLLDLDEAQSTENEEVYVWTGESIFDQVGPEYEVSDEVDRAEDAAMDPDEPTPEPTPEPTVVEATSLKAPEEPRHAEVPTEPQDYLMWVGAGHYPLIQDFIDEAERLGVSKRVGRFPAGVVPGKSRIFLAHDEDQRGHGVVFGYFTVQRLDVINSAGLGQSTVLDGLRIDAETVDPPELTEEQERGCGRREVQGARYLTAYPNPEFDAVTDREPDGSKLHKTSQAHGPLVIFGKPVLASSIGIEKRFRSFVKVDADEIFDGERTTLRPREAAAQALEIPELVGLESNPTGRWTDAERQALRQMVERYGSPFRAISDFATVTGRSKAGVTYQWYNRLRPEGETEGDEG